MKCFKCKKEIKQVNVISECWQKGEVEDNKIVSFSGIEEILETVKVEHRDDNCFADLTDLIEG